MIQTKTCTKCDKNKPLTDFSVASKSERFKDNIRSRCKQCVSAYDRDRQRSKRYNITPEQYDGLNVAQNGRCAICERPRPLCVDHDHDTGAVRGLLCQKCNKGIGLLDDDPNVLIRAMEYV